MKLHSKARMREEIKDFINKNPDGVIEILGPTASGKTGLSIETAHYIERLQETKNQDTKVEIISADSRQVYKGCDISAAKISQEDRQGIPHHGIDLVTMDEPFNVKQFQDFAFRTIQDIQSRGKRVMLCGGTMLWLDAVSENYIFSDNLSSSHTEDQGDRGRFEKSNKKSKPLYPFLKIGLHWERDILYERINQRAIQQFKNGLIEETEKLMQTYDLTGQNPNKKTLHPNVASSFGYREIAQYLEGRMSYDKCLERNQQRNRNYAKRQLTWWRGREDVMWIDGQSL